MIKLKLQSKILKWLLSLVVIFFLLSAILTGAYLYFLNKYENKILPGIKIGNIEVGGLGTKEARQKLENKITQINQEGIGLKYEGAQINLTPKVSSLSGDISYEVIKFQPRININQALEKGRGKNFFKSLQKQISLLFEKKNIPVKVELNRPEIKKIIHKNFQQFEIPARDATLVISTSSLPETIDYTIQKEKLGKIINYQDALDRIKNNLKQLNNSTIQLKDQIKYPRIHKRDCLNLENKIKNILNQAPVNLIYKEEKWKIGQEKLVRWMELYPEQDAIGVSLRPEKISRFLKQKVAPSINREPVNARFEIEEEKVTQFKASQEGVEVKIPETASLIKDKLSNSSTNTIEILTKKVKSKINIDNINNLGIKEVIGTGHSNFAGSPSNRIHNIKVGAQSLNGLLIKPEEEFSLVGALGRINAQTGYKPELVIKGNKTVPEYGGGLCQIGTTMFRTALDAGLKITERKSHSYRVSYYEPAGTDATIYNPKPDFKFINDTDNYILIQYRIEGYDLYFDLWGTDDGRKVTTTDPIIYNITYPGPTKEIETTDLEPGQKKCTESAHNGADAYFDYIITYADGETRERRFHSHYSPWRAVCLIGAEKISTEEEKENSAKENEQQATSTEE